MQSGYWQDLTTRDFTDIDPESTIALLPVAAIEQHGPHLPLATDALINSGIVEAALPLLPPQPAVLALPAMNVGASAEHGAFPGTLSIGADALAASWVEIGRDVSRAGLRKLVIFNSHGGQTAIVDLAALRLRAERSMLVARANYFAFGLPPGDDRPASAGEIHGGELETSLMLYLAPELVRREAIEDFAGLPQRLAETNRWLGAERPIGIGWMSQDLHPSGASGNAAAAGAERGARYLKHLSRCLADLLVEIGNTPLGILGDPQR